MADEPSGSGGRTPPEGPGKKIPYAIVTIAVVILAAVLTAKFGFGTDLLNPAGAR